MHYLPGMAETRFTFRADPFLARALKSFCREEEMKPSQVFRKALRDYLETKKQGKIRKAA